MLEDPFKDPGWEPAYGSLNDDMVDLYEQLNNADRFNKKMHTFISECYDRIDLPIVEQQECTSVIGKFNSQVTDLESTHGNIINTVTGNVAGPVISEYDPNTDTGDNHQSDQEEEEEEDEEETDE
jgi:hypothetical protein